MGVARGHGKLLLFGEHAAVYGHPAIGIQLEEYLEVSVEPGEHRWVLPDLPPRESELVRKALAALEGAPEGGRIGITGNLPMSVGFGSSAAFCTALVRAAGGVTAADAGAADDREALWGEAHRIEHVFHGTPSGIDTGLSVYPGASIVYPDPPALPRRQPARLPHAALLVGAIPRTSTTAQLVAGIRAMREQDPAAVDHSLHRLGRLSQAAATPESCPDANVLGRIADQAQTILRTLGLSTTELDEVVTALHDAGALGAKLSGAGGGGAFYGVFSSRIDAQRAVSVLEKRMAQQAIEVVCLRPYEIGSAGPEDTGNRSST
ncbi:MAG: mevalonate kinase [Spirochaetota bacterium]